MACRCGVGERLQLVETLAQVIELYVAAALLKLVDARSDVLLQSVGGRQAVHVAVVSFVYKALLIVRLW